MTEYVHNVLGPPSIVLKNTIQFILAANLLQPHIVLLHLQNCSYVDITASQAISTRQNSFQSAMMPHDQSPRQYLQSMMSHDHLHILRLTDSSSMNAVTSHVVLMSEAQI